MQEHRNLPFRELSVFLMHKNVAVLVLQAADPRDGFARPPFLMLKKPADRHGWFFKFFRYP